MNVSAPFVRRPVATTLLTIAVVLAGILGFLRLPVAPLPQVDFPTISVFGSLPGASAEVVATSVATPLERHLGQIADVTEMTSSSNLSSTRIILQFGLDRDIDGAARDVQAAINAARADLPASLRSNPTYRKLNPGDTPILILALTSDIMPAAEIYDVAARLLQQKLSQVDGVGWVNIGGGALPAVRVQLNPRALFQYGIGLDDVRAALAAANANMPKGSIDDGDRNYQILSNDRISRAEDYQNLVIAYRDGAPVRLSDVGTAIDSVENTLNLGLANGKRALLLVIYRQPGANIIATVDRIHETLPQLLAAVPPAIDVREMGDRTIVIRASLHEVERALIISVVLVILVVFIFLQNWRAALIPSVAVPTSLIGTFGVMHLLGYSLDNISLMALTISAGFVVDDAIVVLENIARHLEAGKARMRAAIDGAGEVAFTVLSMSLSLIAVFLPILLMGGIVGRLFREFAATLSIAVAISLVISLTTTPMMCALLLDRKGASKQGWARPVARAFDGMLHAYDRSLGWALRHSRLVAVVLVATIALNIILFMNISKGFFPQQDSGRLFGSIQADQSISFQLMREKLAAYVEVISADPAVEACVGFTGGSETNSGFLFVTLKPKSDRNVSADALVDRLRPQLAKIPGSRVFLQVIQDIRAGGRPGTAQYQYTLESDTLPDLLTWSQRLVDAMQTAPELADVSSDLQIGGLESRVVVDRDTASRLGISMSSVTNALYSAFGQRQVSTIYTPQNQYRVVMELAPEFAQTPEALSLLYLDASRKPARATQVTNAVAGTVSASGTGSAATTAADDAARNRTANQLGNVAAGSASTGSALSTGAAGTMTPLSAFSRVDTENAPLSVNHSGHFVAGTISFNLAPGYALGDALSAFNREARAIGMPATVRGSFQGTAAFFKKSLESQPLLILAALVSVYIVLGILYESYIHPITILTTLPSAGVGALLALMGFGMEFSIIALIGILLLIGIVKKNAIMMIDVAISTERARTLSTVDAIHKACLLRFRPIMMTTFAALFGALPLAIGFGDGAELRQPLGVSIVGGLILSQLLTLYTTPVVFLYLDRFRHWCRRQWRPRATVAGPAE